MAALSQRLRAGGRNAVHALAPTVVDSVSDVPAMRDRLRRMAFRQDRQGDRLDRQAADIRQLREQLGASRKRVDQLQSEIQETRRLQQRVAELTDLVGEVLLPAVDRDDERIRAALDTFARASF